MAPPAPTHSCQLLLLLLLSTLLAALAVLPALAAAAGRERQVDRAHNPHPLPDCPVYNTSARRHATKLNVHLVPHTHDDSGWLKTFDQYFWGTRQDIQTAAVQHVLSTVVQALKENPDRRFSYAEMSFFSAWWRRQPPSVQADVRALVKAGRLDFINGGFVQHDEAAAHYVAMLDQTTRGHRFLNRTFGITPRVGWQIDPFGHSSTQAALMSAAMGFEALFFGRADYQDMHVRSSRKQLEMLWRASASWGEYGQVFTHNYPSGNYGPPSGFNWDYGAWDEPIVDDPSSPEYNVPARVDAFVAASHEWGGQMVGNDVLFMMGSDFQYANAHAWFINLDRLIHYVNLDGRVNVFYSTPAAYVAAKAAYPASDVAWPVKTDDFFPYADCPHCYWTGYFTSRPTSKGYIRTATAYLNAARQLQALAAHTPAPTPAPTPTRSSSSNTSTSSSSTSSLEPLEFAVSLTQHHDAITGTEKQAVANDYARYIFLGMQEASGVVNTALTHLLLSTAPTPAPTAPHSSTPPQPHSRHNSSKGITNALLQLLPTWLRHHLRRWLPGSLTPFSTHDDQQQQKHHSSSSSNSVGGSGSDSQTVGGGAAAAAGGLQLVQCPLLNVSVCGATVAATSLRHSNSGVATPEQQQQQQHLRQLKLYPAGSSQVQHLHAKQHVTTATPSHADTDSSSSSSGSDDTASSAAVAGVGVGGDAGVLVVAYNPLAWARREVVRVPVAHGAAEGVSYRVEDADGAAVTSQVLRVSRSTAQLQQGLAQAGLLPDPPASAASYEVAFGVHLPPLGYATYALLAAHNTSTATTTSSSSTPLDVASAASAQPAAAKAESASAAAEQPLVYSNGVLSLALHAVTGRLLTVSADDGSWSMQLSQELMWYRSSNGDEQGGTGADADGTTAAAGKAGAGKRAARGGGNGGQSSGAYIFRPAGGTPEAIPLLAPDQPVSVTVTSGPVVTEITQTWASWASLTTRLYAGADTLEQEWTVGPIPTADNVGKEIIVRTTTDLQTAGVLFTDSNGREMLTRWRNYRPSWPLQVTEPVAGNYYPITAAVAITDGCLALGLATDRAQGAASLADGQLEVMLHRVTTVDDARGVGEPLNETLCGCTGSSGCDCPAGGLPARGRHMLVLGPTQASAAGLRAAQQQLNDPLVLAFADLEQLAPAADAAAAARSQHSSTAGAGAVAAPAGAASKLSGGQQGVVAGLGLSGRWSGAADAVLAAGGLPSNVHLLTLMRAEEGDPSQLILRLAHSFQVGEDPNWSAPAQIDLQQLLAVPILRVQELSLTAAQHKEQQPKPRAWTAGEVISAQRQQHAQDGWASGGSWGQAFCRELRSQSSCRAPHAGGSPSQQKATLHGKGSMRGVRRVAQAAATAGGQQQALQEGPYNIWDHSGGDSGGVVELFPQEIRTWLVTVEV